MNKQEKITKTTGQILKENVCTLFNLLNLLIAIALACVHAWSNMFFILIYAMIAICLYLKDHILAQDILKMAIPDNQTWFIFLLFVAMGIAVERILALTICREKTKIKDV